MFIGDTIDDPIPVAYVETTGFKIGGGKVVEAYNQTLRIGNLTEWSRLWRKFAFQDEMEIGIAGEIKLKTGPITVGVDTKKVQKFQGMCCERAVRSWLSACRPSQRYKTGAGVS